MIRPLIVVFLLLSSVCLAHDKPLFKNGQCVVINNSRWKDYKGHILITEDCGDRNCYVVSVNRDGEEDQVMVSEGLLRRCK
jgi:hypothetical protein